MDDTALTPTSEQTVEFYGDSIPVAQTADGEIWVGLTPLAEFLGLDAKAQRRRVARDRVLAQRVRKVVLTSVSGQRRDTLSLPLDLLPGWLFGIDTSRVRPELQDKLDRYRSECFKVLWNAFQNRLAPASSNSLVAIAEMGRAITSLAEEQLRLEARIDNAARYSKGLDVRLRILEDKLQPAAYITDDQAAEVSGQVKALAELLTGKDKSQNWYQGIFAELYRRFGVSSYKNVRQGQYKQVLGFLEDWRQAAGAPTADEARS